MWDSLGAMAVRLYINCTNLNLRHQCSMDSFNTFGGHSHPVQLMYGHTANFAWQLYLSVHQLNRMQMAAKWMKSLGGTFVTSIPIRIAAMQAFRHSSQLSPIHMYRPFKIGCTSVHILYRMHMAAKWIQSVSGTFVTSIQFRTVNVRAHSHGSVLSHIYKMN